MFETILKVHGEHLLLAQCVHTLQEGGFPVFGLVFVVGGRAKDGQHYGYEYEGVRRSKDYYSQPQLEEDSKVVGLCLDANNYHSYERGYAPVEHARSHPAQRHFSLPEAFISLIEFHRRLHQ